MYHVITDNDWENPFIADDKDHAICHAKTIAERGYAATAVYINVKSKPFSETIFTTKDSSLFDKKFSSQLAATNQNIGATYEVSVLATFRPTNPALELLRKEWGDKRYAEAISVISNLKIQRGSLINLHKEDIERLRDSDNGDALVLLALRQ